MKKFSIILSAFIIFLQQDLHAQLFDFDSLVLNDVEFKKAIEARPDFKDLFQTDEIIKLTIESDFKNLIKRKYKGEYQPATFRYYVNDTIVITREIKIKPRGNVRRSTCYFPPIMLNFKKGDAMMEQMKEFDKIKMVMDCKRGTSYEQYLLAEYYAYKLYNLITDYSFKVRLFEFTMTDSNNKMKSLQSYAYLIENEKQLAERLNAIPFERKSIRDQLTDLETLARGYLFQYLIGNTDWSIPALHNVKMIKSKDPNKAKPYFVPYDFDYAGIVNTPYAVPDERLGIESVRERVYRGVCIEEQYMLDAAQRFIDQKKEIYDLYRSSTLLDKRTLTATINYLDDFYRIIESDHGFRNNILQNCRQ